MAPKRMTIMLAIRPANRSAIRKQKNMFEYKLTEIKLYLFLLFPVY